MSSLGATHSWVAMSYPLLITGSGIIVCILTTLIATDLRPARVVSEIESTLKVQLVVSTLIMTPVSTRGSALAAACQRTVSSDPGVCEGSGPWTEGFATGAWRTSPAVALSHPFVPAPSPTHPPPTSPPGRLRHLHLCAAL